MEIQDMRDLRNLGQVSPIMFLERIDAGITQAAFLETEDENAAPDAIGMNYFFTLVVRGIPMNPKDEDHRQEISLHIDEDTPKDALVSLLEYGTKLLFDEESEQRILAFMQEEALRMKNGKLQSVVFSTLQEHRGSSSNYSKGDDGEG